MQLTPFRPSSWSAATRLATVGAAIVAISVALTAALIVWRVDAAMTDHAQASLETNLRLARELLRVQGGDGPLRIVGEHLVTLNGRVLDGDFRLVDTVRDIAGGTATVFRGDLRVSTNVVKPNGMRAIGTRLAVGPVRDTVLVRGRSYRGEADILGVSYFAAYEPLYDGAGAAIGILYVGVKKADYLALVTLVQRSATFGGVVLCLLGSSTLFVAVRRTFQPLDRLRRSLAELAAGRLDALVPALDRADEIGRMAEAVQVFKEQAVCARDLAAEQAKERDAKDRSAERLAELVAVFERQATDLVGSVGMAAHDLRTTASNMAGTAGRTAEQAASVALTSQQASENVQIMAAATEQLSASVSEITQQVSLAAQTAGQAAADARRTDEIVRALADGAQRIGDVVGLISTIAHRTHLLALNATIEAARAGDAGKCFAIVAGEVKSLAHQTAQATNEIAGQVEQMRAATREAVEALQSINGTITELSGIARGIAEHVAEQGQATREIAHGVQQAATGAEEVTNNIRVVRGAVDESGQAAEDVLAASLAMSRQAAELTVKVGAFVEGVRAA